MSFKSNIHRVWYRVSSFIAFIMVLMTGHYKKKMKNDGSSSKSSFPFFFSSLMRNSTRSESKIGRKKKKRNNEIIREWLGQQKYTKHNLISGWYAKTGCHLHLLSIFAFTIFFVQLPFSECIYILCSNACVGLLFNVLNGFIFHIWVTKTWHQCTQAF